MACPALMISSIASGQGKTTITAALAAYFSLQGKRVRVFKCGPDFIDPTILEKASGYPVYQLDLWMVGEQQCKELIADAAQQADLVLIEGVMGLFDGEPSTADLACVFDIPVLIIIDASAMAQTFGAVIYGLAHYRPLIHVTGVIANKVNSEGHSQLLQRSLHENISYCGAIPASPDIHLPERHLGLHRATEIKDIEYQLEKTALLIEKHITVPLSPVEFSTRTKAVIKPALQGVRIGIARDNAFCFIYQANLDLLLALGAELFFFSPCEEELPPVDSLYLPGGYPELFANVLANNNKLKQQIKQHYKNNKPILAECGGMMLLVEELIDFNDQSYSMAGLIEASCYMKSQLTAIGLQQGDFFGQSLRGHTFHFSTLQTNKKCSIERFRAYNPSGQVGEWIFKHRRLIASYVHWYFPSNPEIIVRLLKP